MADLERLKAQLQLQDHNVEEYVQDVKQWADGKNMINMIWNKNWIFMFLNENDTDIQCFLGETAHQGTLQTLCPKIEALTSSIKTKKQRIYDKNGK